MGGADPGRVPRLLPPDEGREDGPNTFPLPHWMNRALATSLGDPDAPVDMLEPVPVLERDSGGLGRLAPTDPDLAGLCDDLASGLWSPRPKRGSRRAEHRQPQAGMRTGR